MRALCFSILSVNVLAVSLLLGGCDLFTEEDTTIRVSGTVVLEETSEPVEGLSVVLDESAGLYDHVKVARVQTDSEGRFALQYEAVESYGYTLFINDSPPEPHYSGGIVVVKPGERRNLGVIELSHIED